MEALLLTLPFCFFLGLEASRAYSVKLSIGLSEIFLQLRRGQPLYMPIIIDAHLIHILANSTLIVLRAKTGT
ncbi:hypothetical protein [Moorena sp. SIO4G3]|uniref:hypothetical protein n=1 Tax=Moorena sp. SIO4G3 TaxID=2607821 RepID=UPI00142C26A3|nr:hypothetical protein [Moorena sp. SIO4G3]NEO76662.1 hypothetical protein [Moorena sp. SIO4G3]